MSMDVFSCDFMVDDLAMNDLALDDLNEDQGKFTRLQVDDGDPWAGLSCPPWDPQALEEPKPVISKRATRRPLRFACMDLEQDDEEEEKPTKPKPKRKSRPTSKSVAAPRKTKAEKPKRISRPASKRVDEPKAEARKNATSKISPEEREELRRIRETLPDHALCPRCDEFWRTRFYDFNNYRKDQIRYKCVPCNKKWTLGKPPRTRTKRAKVAI
ncbi:uncharacterized protein LOC112344176 [Selaginella moellendorffii]|uniref:uncharacterized protein LOC112344176 n=1 Tax=Selaginella moellendorffii TaxID=88036 RepID=UPI000D1D0BA4|nr:uncharacterized protein LOC112344176 [Selaginella moellendorffii]|eukprot:XP_024524267.1 uncharacterized protein LOC112344176 [Selaginella moellendorffii]